MSLPPSPCCLHDIVASCGPCGLRVMRPHSPSFLPSFLPPARSFFPCLYYLGLQGIIMKALLRKCGDGGDAASEWGGPPNRQSPPCPYYRYIQGFYSFFAVSCLNFAFVLTSPISPKLLTANCLQHSKFPVLQSAGSGISGTRHRWLSLTRLLCNPGSNYSGLKEALVTLIYPRG